MAVSEDLLIKIQADTSSVVKGMEDLNKAFKVLSESTKKTENAFEGNDKTMKGLSLTVISLNQAFELASKAIGAVIGPIQNSVKAFLEQEKAEQAVANSLRLVGQYSQQTLDHFIQFTDELGRNSAFSGETIMQLVSMSKVMGLSDKQTKKLIQTSADLATITGKDITSAYQELQGTFTGVIGKTTGKLIPALKDLTEEQKKAGVAVDLVANKIRGSAKASVDTLGGSLSQLDNAWGDLTKAVGRFFVEFLDLPNVFKVSKSVIQEMQKSVETFTSKIEILKNVDWQKIGSSVLILAGAIGTLQVGLMAFNAAAAISAIGGVGSAIAAMGGSSVIMAAITAKISAFALAIKGAAVSAASFVLPAVGFVAAAAAIEILIRNMERFGELGKTIEAIFQGVAARVNRGFAAMAIGILSATEKVLEFVDGFAGIDNTDLLTSVRSGMTSLGGIMERSDDQVDQFGDKLKEVSKNLDLGLAGEAFKMLSDLMKDSAKDAAAASSTYQDMGGSLDEVTRDADKFMSAFQGLNLANVAQAQNIATAKGDELTAIQNALNLEMIKLDLKAQEIRLSQEYNEGEKNALLDQIELAKQLAGEKAKKDSDESRVSAAGPNMFDGFTKGIDAFKTGTEQFSGTIAGGFTGGLSSFIGGVGMIMGAADALLGMAQKMIDFIPETLDKIAKLFNSARELPERITKSLKGMTKAIERFVAEIVPNFFKGFLDGLDTLFDSMFDGLPKAFEKLISSLPSVFQKFMDRIPGLIKKFIVGLLTSGQKFIDIIINGFIKDSPKLLKSFLKGIPEVVKAIVGGIVEAMKQSFNSLAKNFGFGNVFKTAGEQLEDGLGKLGKAAAKESAQVFKVLDIEAAARSAKQKTSELDPKKAGKDIMKWLLDALNKAVNFFKKLGGYLWDGFTEAIGDAVAWFKEKGGMIWNGFKEEIGDITAWFKEKGGMLWEGFKEKIGDITAWFKEKGGMIWNGFTESIGDIAVWFKEKGTMMWGGFSQGADMPTWFKEKGGMIWTGFTTAVTDMAAWFKEKGGMIWTGFTTAVTDMAAWFKEKGGMIWNGFTNVVKDLGAWFKEKGGMIWTGLTKSVGNIGEYFKGLGSDIWNGLKSGISNFDWGSLIKIPSAGGGGGGGGVLKQLGLAAGGIVPLYAAGGTFVPRGTDTVPAMLTPGEFVVNRQATANNLGLLNTLNNGGNIGKPANVSNEYNFTINLKIDASSQNLDATFVRNKLIPDIKKELKDSSLRGEFLMSEKGIR
jgi:uncharacterized protein YukE